MAKESHSKFVSILGAPYSSRIATAQFDNCELLFTQQPAETPSNNLAAIASHTYPSLVRNTT